MKILLESLEKKLMAAQMAALEAKTGSKI